MTERPIPPAAARLCPVIRRESLGGAYVLLTFAHPEVAKAEAGQFAMIQPEAGTDLILRRPFSIMDTDPAAGLFTIFLKAVGPGSKAVFDLREGENARVLGPLGHGFSAPGPGESVHLVGGGYGVAPFALFSRHLKSAGGPFHLFYGGRTGTALPLVGGVGRGGIGLTLSTDDGTRGETGRVTAPLLKALDREKGQSRLYACGPEAMMQAVAKIAAERNLPCEVSLDPWMGCGLGTCLGCVVKIQEADELRPRNRPACTEGPVFDAKRVVWPH